LQNTITHTQTGKKSFENLFIKLTKLQSAISQIDPFQLSKNVPAQGRRAAHPRFHEDPTLPGSHLKK